MSVLDNIRDGVNWLVGGATNHGQEGFILRGRLADMSGSKPYAAAALTKLDEVAADGYDHATEFPVVRDAFMSGLRTHLTSLPADQRFTEFKSAVDGISSGATSGMTDAFAQAPENVRTALMNAVVHNPNFLQHVSQNPNGPMGSLLTPDVLKNPQYSGPIADILNSVANDPNYDLARLDRVGTAAQTFFEADKKTGADRKPEDIERAKRELLNAVRDAGGNVPAFANFNMGMLMQFMKDLFNGDINLAIGNLANGLGIQGQQLTDFQGLMQPIAGTLKFMGQDYYDYFNHYGPQFVSTGTNAWNTIDGLMNGQRVQGPDQANRTQTIIQDPATATVRTSSLSGEALTTQVAALDSNFNLQATAARTDGYKPDVPVSEVAYANSRYTMGGMHATVG